MARDLAAFAIRRALYPLWAAKNRSSRLRYWQALEKSQYDPETVMQGRQLTLLQGLVRHAFAHCPYYRHKLTSAGVRPDDIRRLDDIELIPTISKQEIQEHGPELISATADRRTLIRDQTGGSTGSPLVFYYDNDRLDSRVAATLRHNRWAGWDPGDRAAVIWGAPQDLARSPRLRDRVREWIQDRRIMLDASALDERSMASFTVALRRYQPKILQAYSNTLGLYAQYLRSRGIDDIRPRGIVCSAEVLTTENRRLIEETFGCRVFDRYGCREFAVIASECEVHDGMHVNAENLLVEVLADGRSRRDENGQIVVTDLRNLAMPLLRYEIRDVGSTLTRTCSCPRKLPLLAIGGGRSTDFLLATRGAIVSGVVIATYVTTNVPGIGQIQFVQDEPAMIKIRLVKGPGWSSATAVQLEAKARHYLGEDMRFEFEFCTVIPSEKSGKYRFSICNIPITRWQSPGQSPSPTV
jgi:phenylacetate-CoA ligase